MGQLQVICLNNGQCVCEQPRPILGTVCSNKCSTSVQHLSQAALCFPALEKVKRLLSSPGNGGQCGRRMEISGSEL